MNRYQCARFYSRTMAARERAARRLFALQAFEAFRSIGWGRTMALLKASSVTGERASSIARWAFLVRGISRGDAELRLYVLLDRRAKGTEA